MRLRNYFCPIVNWYFGVATPPYTPAVFCFCCHNFFYIATFILYNGWGDFLVQTKLLKGDRYNTLVQFSLHKIPYTLYLLHLWTVNSTEWINRHRSITAWCMSIDFSNYKKLRNADVYNFTKETSQIIYKDKSVQSVESLT